MCILSIHKIMTNLKEEGDRGIGISTFPLKRNTDIYI